MYFGQFSRVILQYIVQVCFFHVFFLLFNDSLSLTRILVLDEKSDINSTVDLVTLLYHRVSCYALCMNGASSQNLFI